MTTPTRKVARFALAAAAGMTCLFISDNLPSSQQSSLITQADARVGRPLTPGSVAGVARRTDRRAIRRGAIVGGAAVGTGAYYGYGAYRDAYGPNRSGDSTYGSYGGGGDYARSGDSTYGSYAGAGDYARRGDSAYGYYGGSRDYARRGDSAYGSYAGVDNAVAYCMQRFRSYDPTSSTYLGYDGLRHACP